MGEKERAVTAFLLYSGFNYFFFYQLYVYLFLFPTPAALSNVLHGDVDIILRVHHALQRASPTAFSCTGSTLA